MMKICSILRNSKKMSRLEQKELDTDLQLRVLKGLNTYAINKKKLRNIEQLMKFKIKNKKQRMIMNCLK